MVPRSRELTTLIEYAHRLTSGLTLILTLGLVVLARRVYAVGHPVRRAALWAFVLIIVEAGIGAGIVLLELVASNSSSLRAAYVAGHLANTMVLIAAMTATAAWVESAPRPWSLVTAPASRRALGVGLGLMLLVGASGAVVALGDTLFPSVSLRAGLAADFSPGSHFLLRLRVWHPVVAVGVGLYLMGILGAYAVDKNVRIRTLSRVAVALVLGQWLLGLVNLLALAPLGLQMAHLLVANVLWISLVWLFVSLRSYGSAHLLRGA